MPEPTSTANGLLDLCGVLCHQIPSRSPQFDAAVFPLCFRCTGLYLGLASAFTYLAASGGFRRRLPALRCALIVSVLTAPMVFDGWGNALGLWASPGWLRALTGIGVGAALPMLLVPLAAGDLPAARPTVGHPLAMLWPVAVAGQLLFLVGHPGWLAVFEILAVVAAAGPVLLLGTLFLAVWRNRSELARTLGVPFPPAVGDLMGHLFISYSRKDVEFVDRLVLALEQYGFQTWKDVKAIAGGEVWKASISRAVRECDAFLIILSPQSAGSPNVSKELAVGTKHSRHVLPILFQPCTIPDKMDYDLAELQWVNFAEEPFEMAFGKLVHALGGEVKRDRAQSNEVRELGEFLARMASAIGASPLRQQKAHPVPAPKPPEPAKRPEPAPQPPPVPDPPPKPPAGNPKFCIYCAAKLTPGHAFCTGCGKAVRK